MPSWHLTGTSIHAHVQLSFLYTIPYALSNIHILDSRFSKATVLRALRVGWIMRSTPSPTNTISWALDKKRDFPSSFSFPFIHFPFSSHNGMCSKKGSLTLNYLLDSRIRRISKKEKKKRHRLAERIQKQKSVIYKKYILVWNINMSLEWADAWKDSNPMGSGRKKALLS